MSDYTKISIQGVLLPANGRDYKRNSAVKQDFIDGKNFIHVLHGVENPCNKWDFKVGDMIKFRYDGWTKACFYRLIKKDIT